MTNARLRARLALQASGLGEITQLERIAGTSNEAWRAGPFVVRICVTPGSDRLPNEALVARLLPSAIPYPGVISHGRSATATWLVTERVSGITLGRAWPDLDDVERRAAVAELAALMRAFHAAPADGVSTMETSEECPHPLPAHRLLDLLGRLESISTVDPDLIADASTYVHRHLHVLDSGPYPGLIHGDLHLENVLWHAGHVSALLDLEWSRPGPPDLDLDILLRFCADPSPQVAPDYASRLSASDFRDVPLWLREDYPDLFSHADLRTRLSLYGLAYDLLQLARRPPSSLAVALPNQHPAMRLRRRLAGEDPFSVLNW